MSEATSLNPELHLSPRTLRNIAILQRLADQGADIATRFHEQVTEHIPAGPILAQLGGTHSVVVMTHDIMATYDLIARAIRRTVLLIEHLAKTPTPPAKPRLHPRDATPNPTTPEPLETIRPLRPNPAEPELYQPEYRDRLDPLDRKDELGRLPTAKIIASIHQALDAGEKLLAQLPSHRPQEDGEHDRPAHRHPSSLEPNPEVGPLIRDDPGAALSNPERRRP